ncbi:MAG: hypothetical protein ACRECP_01615 [Methylocella sp.]
MFEEKPSWRSARDEQAAQSRDDEFWQSGLAEFRREPGMLR